MDTVTGTELVQEPADESLQGDRPVGACVLDLAPHRALQTCIPRGCDLVLVGLAGRMRLDSGTVLGAGRLVLWPRGAPLTVRALSGDARVGVVAVPAGAEQLLAALNRGQLPSGTLVALATDCGVELVLP